MKLTATYWDDRYDNNQTGWDIGFASPPLTTYFDQLTRKDLRILIPGCGNSYEAEYLIKNGFSNVYILDYATTAITRFKQRVPQFSTDHLYTMDFFELKDQFDLIIEQTFFCALDSTLRNSYCQKMNELLAIDGKLIGVLFASKFTGDGPPFGGDKQEYLDLFSKGFRIKILEPCYNSIPQRAGNELFFIFEKQNFHPKK
ncbi:methyltransferase domain-containing protein [Aquimarina sp. W85]|uniref:methyltransferase domain-containing protein n=1 Tax=Aquimarina rhodophyticola TaxID=3342246 RepID=UPI003672A575